MYSIMFANDRRGLSVNDETHFEVKLIPNVKFGRAYGLLLISHATEGKIRVVIPDGVFPFPGIREWTF